MIDNGTIFELINTLQVTNRWLDSGNARMSLSVSNAIKEFNDVAAELKNIEHLSHSVFSIDEIKALHDQIISTTKRLEALPYL